MRLLDTLDDAIILEEKIFACYELVRGLTKDGLAEELGRLAREEKSHANVLRTGKNYVVQARDAFGEEAVSDLDILSGIRPASRLEEELKSRRSPFPQALQKLCHLEKKFEKIHLNAAVEFKDFSLKKLFEALARADAEHGQRVDRLLAALESPRVGRSD